MIGAAVVSDAPLLAYRFNVKVRVAVTAARPLEVYVPLAVSFRRLTPFSICLPLRVSLIVSLAWPALANVALPLATSTSRGLAVALLSFAPLGR